MMSAQQNLPEADVAAFFTCLPHSYLRTPNPQDEISRKKLYTRMLFSSHLVVYARDGKLFLEKDRLSAPSRGEELTIDEFLQHVRDHLEQAMKLSFDQNQQQKAGQ